MSVMVGVRVSEDIRRLLHEKATKQGFSSFTPLHRELLERYAGSDEAASGGVSGPRTNERPSQHGDGCPILSVLQGGFYCPHLSRASQDERVGDGNSVTIQPRVPTSRPPSTQVPQPRVDRWQG